MIQIWFISLLLQEYIGPRQYCNLVQIIFSVEMAEFPIGNQTFYLFHIFLYPQLFNFSHCRNFVAKFEVSSYIMESDINSITKWFDKTSRVPNTKLNGAQKAYLISASKSWLYKKHYPLKLISAMFVTIHSVHSKSAA